MRPRSRTLLAAAIVLLLAYGGYAAAVTVSSGEANVGIVAGTEADGTMYYRCDAAASTPGACVDEDGHAAIRVAKRDRVHVTVRTDDGKRHSHDFRLTGAPYLLWPAGIEMELEAPQESKSFTAYASGDYRFVCELAGHEERGMWGTLHVRG